MGYFPVLAVFTVQVTAYSCHGKDAGSGQKMKKWLLLYRIDVNRTWVSVYDSPESAVNVDPDSALPALTVLNQTPFRT